LSIYTVKQAGKDRGPVSSVRFKYIKIYKNKRFKQDNYKRARKKHDVQLNGGEYWRLHVVYPNPLKSNYR